jgi:hypothetical protein
MRVRVLKPTKRMSACRQCPAEWQGGRTAQCPLAPPQSQLALALTQAAQLRSHCHASPQTATTHGHGQLHATCIASALGTLRDKRPVRALNEMQPALAMSRGHVVPTVLSLQLLPELARMFGVLFLQRFALQRSRLGRTKTAAMRCAQSILEHKQRSNITSVASRLKKR